MNRTRSALIAWAALFVLGATPAQEQTTAGEGDEAIVHLAQLLADERHDEVIAQATKLLKEAEEKGEDPDKSLLYLRGRAAYAIAWYGLAESDLAPLGDFIPFREWLPASEFAARIPRLRELAPANVHEIKRADAVIFRVYYDERNPWTDTVIATLPEAYQAVCGFYGAELAETAVFVFSEGPRYNAFYGVIGDQPPTDWQWAGGGTGILYFCERDADGTVSTEPHSDYFRSMVAHEFSHCLVRRYIGIRHLPTWLNEGLAMLCGALIDPGKLARNDAEVRRFFETNHVLPLAQIATADGFYRTGEHQAAYAQGFAMVRYLESEIGRDGLMELLLLLRDEGELDAAFTKGWGITTQQFYDMWLEASMRMLEAGAVDQ